MGKKKVKIVKSWQVEKKRAGLPVEQWLRDFLQATFDELNRDVAEASAARGGGGPGAARQPPTAPTAEEKLMCELMRRPADWPTRLGGSGSGIPFKNIHGDTSKSRTSVPEEKSVRSNDSMKFLLKKFHTSVVGPDARNAARFQAPKCLISESSNNVLFADERRDVAVRLDAKNLLASGKRPEVVSRFRAVSHTRPLLADPSSAATGGGGEAGAAGVQPRDAATRQEQGRAQSHTQIFLFSNFTETGVRKQCSYLVAGVKGDSHAGPSRDAARQPEDHAPAADHPARQFSRYRIQKYSKTSGVAPQDISLQEPPYAGLICIEDSPRRFSGNIPTVAQTGERVPPNDTQPEQVNANLEPLKPHANTTDEINSQPVKNLTLVYPPVNKVTAVASEDVPSRFIISCRCPGHSSRDSNAMGQVACPTLQVENITINIPPLSYLPRISNSPPILLDDVHPQNNQPTNTCNDTGLCPSGHRTTQHYDTAPSIGFSSQHKDPPSEASARPESNRNPTASFCPNCGKEVKTCATKSLEETQRNAAVTRDCQSCVEPCPPKEKMTQQKTADTSSEAPQQLQSVIPRQVELHRPTAQIRDTTGKNTEASFVSKETCQSESTKSDKEGQELGEYNQQKKKVIEYVSTTSTILQKQVIVRGFFPRISDACRAKNIMSKIKVGPNMTELFEDALCHLKDCKSCSISLSPLVEKLDDKLNKLASSTKIERPEIIPTGGDAQRCAWCAESGDAAKDFARDAGRGRTSQWTFPERREDRASAVFSPDLGDGDGDGDDACVLEPYVDRFQFTDEELDAVFPEGRRGGRRRRGRRRASRDASSSPGGGSRATPDSLQPEPLDADISEASLALFGAADEMWRHCNLDPRRRPDPLPPSAAPARSQGDSRLSTDATSCSSGVEEAADGGTASDGADMPPDSKTSPGTTAGTSPASADTRTIQSPVSMTATSSSGSPDQGSDQEEESSEEQSERGGRGTCKPDDSSDARAAVLWGRDARRQAGASRRRRQELVELMRAKASELGQRCRHKCRVVTALNERLRRRARRCVGCGEETTRVHAKILKEANANAVPPKLKAIVLSSSILLSWEKPDIPDRTILGFEVYVNSRLHERVRSRTRCHSLVTDVDLSRLVSIEMQAVSPRGRLGDPARITVQP